MKEHASMNRIYRLVWSRVHNAWVAVSENSPGRGKTGRGKRLLRRKLAAAAASLLIAPFAQAAPSGGQVVGGAGTISQSGATTTISQSSQSLSLNWQSFNVAPQETVNFLQPSSAAIAVNRIFDTNGSQILGHLNANGQVYLINPNGVLFGQGAQVNVGGLVASTLNLDDASLGGNTRTFSGSGTGSVVNQGTIHAADGGYVALLGNTVSNQGVITAKLGAVALGAGSAATLTFAGNSLVRMQVDQSTLNNLAENKQLIRADGGQVIMSAGAKNSLLASVVNNTGVIEARTVENRNGTIVLLGGMEAGTAHVGGTLDASAPNGGDGGFVETSAAHVNVGNDAKVTTIAPNGTNGTWLIDPIDFTIAAGNGAQTTSSIGATTLSNNLVNSNVSIATNATTTGNGDIFVNSAVSWSANKLTLSAHRNININANLNGSGTASLALQYGQGALAAGNTSQYTLGSGVQVNLPAGNNFSTKLGSNGVTANYIVITSLGAPGSTTGTDLQGMNGNLAGNYVLGGNIDATPTSGWNYGTGFVPVGNNSTGNDSSRFTGVFDGLGHTISNLTINSSMQNTGLFGVISTPAIIRNIGLTGNYVNGLAYANVGGLVGWNYGASSTISNSYFSGTIATTGSWSQVGGITGFNRGKISDSYATGSVSGLYITGGLVGQNYGGSVNNSYATSSVTGGGGGNADAFTGGLIGYNSAGAITNSYAMGNVYAMAPGFGFFNDVGGLVGVSVGNPGSNLAISNSYATGNVTADGSNNGGVGGLVGYLSSKIGNSYATGSVKGGYSTGGLVGTASGATISNTYAMGGVNGGGSYGGGLVGSNINSSTISVSYSTGKVAGVAGGLVGYQAAGGTTSSSYWDTTTSGLSTSAAGTGKTTAQMQTSNLAGFTYTTTTGTGNKWVVVNANGTLNGGVRGAAYPMLTSEYSTTISNTHQLQLMSLGLAGNYTLATNLSAATASTGGNVWGSAGFIPVGNSTTKFTGTLNGQGHTISGLTINQPTANNIGLFGYTNTGANILNIGLTGNSMTGNSNVGALVGYSDGATTISNSYSTGSVSGNSGIGGLAGLNNGTISNSHTTGSVTGSGSNTGGLVGLNNGTISNNYATGSINGGSNVGGLAGSNYGTGTISNSYVTGNVNSTGSNTGGLAGLNNGTINTSYASGDVNSTGNNNGGLVGNNTGTINISYATGNTTGANNVGGLAGSNTGTISTSYSAGHVTGTGSTGGLAGSGSGTVNNGYWNLDTSGQTSSAGGAGLTMGQMRNASNLAGFNFTTTPGATGNNWVIADADGTLNNAGDAAGTTYPMLASEYTTSINNVHQLQLMAMAPTATYSLTTDIVASATVGGDVWSNTGFAPVGNASTPFSGVFDGQGHVISGLTISQPTATSHVGLFGYTGTGSVIRNTALTGINISGNAYVGSVAGYNSGTISNVYVSGNVTGTGAYVGGVTGYNNGGALSNVYTEVGVTSTGTYVGGMTGWSSGTISNSYASGNASGTNYIGGLAGYTSGGAISSSYALGKASGASYVGGLVGYRNGSTISNTYSTGQVTGSSNLGGLVGAGAGGSVTSSYWDTTTSGRTTSAGGTGRTTTQMKTASSLSGFNFTTTPEAAGNNWVIVDVDSSLNNASGAAGATYPLLASEYSTTLYNAHQLQLMSLGLGANYTLATDISAAATATGKDVWGSSGFVPVWGSPYSWLYFSGTLDGLNHTINNLTINLPTTDYVGLFGFTSGNSAIRNVGLTNVSITGRTYVGGLAGGNLGSDVSNVYASGSVSGVSMVGGLEGFGYGVRNSHASGTVSASGTYGYAGGLVGWNHGVVDNSYTSSNINNLGNDAGGLTGRNDGTISNSYATGAVTGQAAGSYHIGGLAGSSYSGQISNSYATGNVSGRGNVGGLVGYSLGAISNSYATGSIAGTLSVGGLAGTSGGAVNNSYATGSITAGVSSSSIGGLAGESSSTISNSHATGAVTAGNYSSNIGGLAGSTSGAITGSYATGNVTAGNYGANAGGLVGLINGAAATVSTSYATSNVVGGSGSNGIGGLVGGNSGGSISNSYATGGVSGSGNVGGLVGGTGGGTITNTYALGNVAGNANSTYVGGLIGRISLPSTAVSNSYSAGRVTGGSYSQYVGGLVGYAPSPSGIVNSFWDTTTSGMTTSSGGLGMTTANMQKKVNFTSATAANGNVNPGWDFTNTWYIYDNLTYPLLRSFMTPLTVTANSYVKTYDGVAFSGGNGVSLSAIPTSPLLGTVSYGGTSQNAKNAGSYTIVPSGLYSYTYIITFANGTLTVNKRPVDLTGSRVYDGTTSVAANIFMKGNIIPGDTVNLSGVGTISSKNVGSYTVTTGTLAVSNANYTLTGGTKTADITPKTLTVTGSAANNKTYDGTTAATLTGGTLSGVVTGDTVTLTQAGNFVSKDVGAGISVVAADSLGGASAGNYMLTQPTGLSANITARVLSLTGTRVYDGTTIVASDIFTLGNLAAGESLNLSGTGSVASKDVLAGSQAVTLGTLALNDGSGLASNYTLTGGTDTATITPRPVSLAGSRMYDGTTTVSSGVYTPSTWSNLVGSETLGLSGAGSVASKDVMAGTQTVALGTLALQGGGNGGQASNYTFTGGTQTLTITPRPVNLSGSRAYDGGTDVVSDIFTSWGNLVGSETLTLSGTGSIASKNVGSYPVTLGTLALGDGTGFASNYTFTGGTHTANITRLSSVNWIGPATGGYWSDPANWAGAAIPDLANVANVVIPTGTNVIFDSAVPGPVSLDTLSSGGLTVNSGTMNIATALTLQSHTQTGGTVGGAGSFTAANHFSQTAGQIAMGGNVSISQATGGLTFASIAGNNVTLSSALSNVILGNLSTGGALGVTANGGTITQSLGASLSVGGISTLMALSGSLTEDIILNNSGNIFGQAVNADGNNVALTSANHLTLGTVTTVGSLTANSTGALNLGTSTVGGNLAVNSGNSNITQAGALIVTGTSDINAGTGNITLGDTGNDFGQAVNLSGNNVSITDAGVLTLGAVTTTGNLTANSTGALNLGASTVGGTLAVNSGNGNITQAGALTVTGASDINAGTGDITLDDTGNSFGSTVTATGTNVNIANAP